MRYRQIVLMGPNGHAPHIPEATVSLTEFDDRPGEYVVGASVSIGQGPMDDIHKRGRLAVRSLSHVWHAVNEIACQTSVGRYIRNQNYGLPPEAILSAEWHEWDGPPLPMLTVKVYSDLPWPAVDDFPATIPGWYIDRPGYRGLGCPPYTERVFGTEGEIRVNGWADTIYVAFPDGIEVTRTSAQPAPCTRVVPDGAILTPLVLVDVVPCPRYGDARRRGRYTIPAEQLVR